MDTELKCNRLTCRIPLNDRAVVTTCSHIFCVNCANELFTAARLCPACETCLTEPDDVVVCSLHPTNDYKTSVLSGLSPSLILEICSRAVSFWQYQVHQELSFQQAVIRNLNEKTAQMQKQLDNVIREANGEISLLTNKTTELERDLELEKRKVRDLQESSRERDKEYQKLKAQHDKIKRKALLAPNFSIQNEANNHEEDPQRLVAFGGSRSNAVDLTAVVGGMEANGIQRTPIMNRTNNTFQLGGSAIGSGESWSRTGQLIGQNRVPVPGSHRQRLSAGTENHHFRSVNNSDRSDSASEVENLLVGNPQSKRVNAGWTTRNNPKSVGYPAQAFTAPKRSGTFRPSIPAPR